METKIYIFVFALAIALLVAISLIVFFDNIIKFLRKILIIIGLKWKRLVQRIRFLHKMACVDLESNSVLIEIIFNLFCHFYEESSCDFHSIEFNKEFFPRGRADVLDMYKWVKLTRKLNYDEFRNMYIDHANNKVNYLSKDITDVKVSVKHFGKLEITPLDDIQHSVPVSNLILRLVKVQNLLYKLDTDMAMWILERRKFFGL